MQPFAGKIKSFYNTSINTTNFSDPQIAADHINAWVRTATRGKISRLVKPGLLNEQRNSLISIIFSDR